MPYGLAPLARYLLLLVRNNPNPSILNGCIMLEKKIKFLEDFGIDRQLYWRVNDIYGRYEWEIMWQKNTTKSWKTKKLGMEKWFELDKNTLRKELLSRKIDIQDFEIQLTSTIFTFVVFCNSAVEEAKSVIGDEKIEEAIKQHKKFAEGLLEAIRKFDIVADKQPSNHQLNIDRRNKARDKSKPLRLLKKPNPLS